MQGMVFPPFRSFVMVVCHFPHVLANGATLSTDYNLQVVLGR